MTKNKKSLTKIMTKNKIYYSRIRSVKPIERGTKSASGLDFFMPEFTSTFISDLVSKNRCISEIKSGNYEYIIDYFGKRILLAPHAKLMIPSGIKVRGKDGITLNACNKSGIGTKKGLDRLAEVVDSDYQGEIHISITNTTPFIIEICENEKLIQFLELHVELDDPIEVPIDELFIEDSDRGENGFGSTNK